MDEKDCSTGSSLARMPSSFAKTEPEFVQDASQVDPTPDAAEEAKAAASHLEETIGVLLRYLLNICTCAVCADMLRRLFAEVRQISQQGLDNLLVANAEGLHKAAKEGSVAAVGRLLACGSKVDELDEWEETPLHHAARAG